MNSFGRHPHPLPDCLRAGQALPVTARDSPAAAARSSPGLIPETSQQIKPPKYRVV